MLENEKPIIKCVERSDDESYAKIVVEPLEKGYGILLGNSLRRVLLSSLPGSAVTSIKIEGVLHEFSTIPGVLEDVTDIIFNLKSLALKGYTDEPLILRIESQGGGIIRAGDIITDPDIEIMNPNLKIATLDNDGRLFMEMTVRRGKGYISSDKNRTPDDVIGVIAIDSIYSPIYKVSYVVEATSVSPITDYDKLTLEIWSNGTISAEDATSAAAKILSDHLRIFMGLTEKFNDSKIIVVTEEEEDNGILNMLIDELNLSVRCYNSLRRAGIDSVGDLIQWTEEDISNVRSLGNKSFVELELKIKDLGLVFRANF